MGVISNDSWFSNIISAVLGVFVAPVVGLIAVVVLFWNEGNYLYTALSLDAAEKVVQTVDGAAKLPANEGKLVHVSGKMSSDMPLVDEQFGVGGDVARMRRIVEMYQWVEHEHTRTKKKLGGGTRRVTEYEYEMEWVEGVEDSRNFYDDSHVNPTSIPFTSDVKQASSVRLGGFVIGDEQLDKLSYKPLALTSQTFTGVPPGVTPKPVPTGSELYVPVEWTSFGRESVQPPKASKEAPQEEEMPVNCGADPAAESAPEVTPEAAPTEPATEAAPQPEAAPVDMPSEEPQDLSPSRLNEPQVGDVRIRFEAIPLDDVTVVAKQEGEALVDFIPELRNARPIMLVDEGVHTTKVMFDNARTQNTMMLWITRVIGGILVFAGTFMVLRPLKVFADFIPMIGSIVGFGIFVVALFVSGGLTVMIIGVAWVYYRPLIGCLILLLGALIFGGLIYLIRASSSKNKPIMATVGPDQPIILN